MRFLLFAVLLSGCAGLKPLERGEWVLAWANEGKTATEVISREDHDQEVVEGRGRKFDDAFADKPANLADQPSPLKVKLGDVTVFRLNEGRDVELLGTSDCADFKWTANHRVDGWSGQDAVEGRESFLYVTGKKPCTGKLKLIDSQWGTHEYDVKVVDPGAPAPKEKKKKAAAPESADAPASK